MKNILKAFKKVPSIKDILGKGTSLKYATQSKVSSSATLSIKDIQKAVSALKKAELKQRKWENELVSSKSWQRSNKKLTRLIDILTIKGMKSNKTKDWTDLRIAYECWYAIQPRYYHPVHLKTRDRVIELLKREGL